MANKALENAQRLALFNRDIAQVEDSKTALSRSSANVPGLRETPVQKAEGDEVVEDGEVGAAGVPEGLLTGIVSSLVLGPFLGVLVGGAQFLAGRNAKKSVLETFAADNELVRDSVDIRKDSVNAFRRTATGLRDFQQLDAAEGALEIATNYSLSANPKTKAKGDQMLTAWDQWLMNFGATQETQEIARDAQDSADARELGATNFSNYNLMKDDYMSESALQIQTIGAVRLGKKALESGDAAMLNIALTMMPKSMDPTSIISLPEKDSVAELGSAFDRIESIFGKMQDGQQVNDNIRISLDKAFNTIGEMANMQQLEVDSRYQRDAIVDLAPKFANRFNIGGEMEPFVPLVLEGVNDNTPRVPGGNAPEVDAVIDLIQNAASKVTEGTTAGLTTARGDVQRGVDAAGNAIDAAGSVINSVGEFIGTGVEQFTRDVERALPGTRRVN